jgi:hypothetical protein
MPAMQLRLGAFSAALAILAATSGNALAQKKYDTGATDTEIKIGNIMPYSGPVSAYGVIGKTEQAYFNKINRKAASAAARSTSSVMTTATAGRSRNAERPHRCSRLWYAEQAM